MFIVAGIARPERFVSAAKELGLTVAGEMRFRDHHWFTPHDIARIERAARDRGAVCIVTTEKDAVRVEGLSRTLPWARVPLRVEVSRPRFGTWLLERLSASGEQQAPGSRQAR